MKLRVLYDPDMENLCKIYAHPFSVPAFQILHMYATFSLLPA